MKNLGAITDAKDLVTKEYVDAIFNGGLDTGWRILTLTGNFNNYSGVTSVYRRIGDLVEIFGAFTPKATTSFPDTTTGYNVASIPTGFRPRASVITMHQGSGLNVWCSRVTTGGIISIERYRQGTTFSNAAAGAWFPFNIMYFTDEDFPTDLDDPVQGYD